MSQRPMPIAGGVLRDALDANSKKITNLAEPTASNDAATKNYVDTHGGGVTFDDTVTQSSSNGVKSSGIWNFVKGLLPNWLTPSYAEPATVSSVSAKADKAVPAAANNFAALNASGNLVDSTKKAADFAAASHTHTKIVDGVKEIAADLTAKVATGGYTDWEPDVCSGTMGSCTNVRWDGAAWVCTFEPGGSTEILTEQMKSGPSRYDPPATDYNATTIYFPDGYYPVETTPTHRVPVTATKTIATTDQVPTVVSPSTASTDAGKAADAKATGDALAAKATPNDITSAVSAHNAANDAHADIRATVGAKVASLSCGSGASQQTITPVNGVADVSPLFTSVDTSTDPTASGLLNNATLDKGIVKVSNALIADACPYGVNVLSAQDLQLVDGCVNTINLNAADVHLVLPTMPIGKQADMLIEITVASGATVSGFSIVAPSGATMERIRMTDDVTLEAPTSGTTIYQFMYTSRRTDDGTGDPAYRVYSAQKKGEVVA